MKIIKAIFLILLFNFPNLSFSSEIYFPLKDKVLDSSLIVIGTVTSATLGEIKQEKHLNRKTQQLKLRLKVKETIYGKEKMDIIVNCFSVSYSIKTKDGGISSTCSTAGFSAYSISKGKVYIAYLTKKNGKFYLSKNTNQYLEEIDDSNKTIEACGQNGNVVPREEKLKKLRLLAKEKVVRLNKIKR